ncbi:MAG: substrate-binding domain-containing protein [Clostridiales bacterium]|nr:substrate-binding domain-containing protein [Clostridiales bacterium]
MSDIRTMHHAEGAYFIEQQLQKYGYNCIMMNSGFTDQSRAEGIRTLCARRAEAVVLIGSTFQSEGVKNAIREYISELPVIIENGYIDLPNVYGVLADEKNGIAECVRFLRQKGKKHLVFINKDDTPSNRLKIEGFCEAIQADDSTAVPHVIWVEGDDEWQSGYNATIRLVREYPKTDGIIYTTDFLANAGIRALLDLGIPIPGQVAVIGVDNSIYAKISYPKLTSLDNKMQLLSITCSDILAKVLNGENVPKKMMIFSNIVERETT